ncbi:MAG: hypothetical protein ACOC1F_01735 [Myxococcota bacterium]
MGLDSARWRRLAWLGAARGPLVWLRISPPPIGLLAAALSSRQRHHVRESLRSLLGRRNPVVEHVDVARTFVHFAQSLAEGLALGDPKRTPTLRVFGERYLHEALERGAGVILGTAHTAGWEAALVGLERVSDVPVLVAMLPEREPDARSFHPASHGALRRVVQVGDPMSSLSLLQHLRSGGMVAMQLDRCPPGMKSVEVRAGCRFWQLPAGPFALAATSGAPIVVVLSRRTGFLSYELHVTRPICVARSDRRATRAAERVARELARHVYAAPTQWFDFAPADVPADAPVKS